MRERPKRRPESRFLQNRDVLIPDGDRSNVVSRAMMRRPVRAIISPAAQNQVAAASATAEPDKAERMQAARMAT